MNTRRLSLEPIRVADASHAGLWLDKFIQGQDVRQHQRDDAQDKFKQQLVDEVPVVAVSQITVASNQSLDLYTEFFWRWKASLKQLGAQMKCLQVDGRLIIGLGAESVLETSVMLHRIYGLPYIPGSALKGLAAFYARQELDPELWGQDKPAYETVFGTTTTAGFVNFHDALYIPGTGHNRQALHTDILTVHHADYYMEKEARHYPGPAAPADWDSPVPVPLLSATGHYLLALSATPACDETKEWVTRAQQILAEALAQYGIGAKTASGYGRATLSDALPVSPQEEAEKVASKPNQQLESFRNRVENAKGAEKDIKKEFGEVVKSMVKKLPPEGQKEIAGLISKRLTELKINAASTQWWPKIQSLA